MLTNEIIDFVANSNNILPHFHIPLQSGSDKILKLMKRRYISELYLDRVKYIRKRIPNACIGADVIVGFPDETDDDFNLTYTFLHNLDVNYFHVFTYWKEKILRHFILRILFLHLYDQTKQDATNTI